MSDADAPTDTRDTHPPDPRLGALQPLVGRWEITGEATGQTSFEWMEGGYFLLQRGHLTRHAGATNSFIEIIGFERTFGATEAAIDITSRVYTDTGDTLDYTYDPDESGLTIWGGPKGSPAAFRGRWNQDRDVLRGAWEWPGGGYSAIMTRVTDS